MQKIEDQDHTRAKVDLQAGLGGIILDPFGWTVEYSFPKVTAY